MLTAGFGSHVRVLRFGGPLSTGAIFVGDGALKRWGSCAWCDGGAGAQTMIEFGFS